MVQENISLDITGISFLFLISLVFYYLIISRPVFKNILVVAFGIRIFVIFLNQNYLNLPDSIGDARNFEFKANELSQNGFLGAIDQYPGLSSYFISWFIALFYSVFGQSELLAQSISLFFGMIIIYLGCIVAEKLWNTSIALKVGWFLALFPTLILYSCLVLREVYVCFFLLVIINSLIDWVQNKNIKSFIIITLSFIAGAHFHGPIIIGLIIFIFIALIENLRILYRDLFKLKIKYKYFFATMVLLIFSIFVAKSDVVIPKIGLLNKDNILGRIVEKNLDYNRGNAKYPEWIVFQSETEIFYKAPIRILYFLFSPFVWDVSKTKHILGLIDGVIYMYLSYLIFINRRTIFRDPALRMIFIILLTFIIVYGITIGNFGTAIRHRSKFIVMFILLAAPLLPKFTLFKKIKN